MDTDPMADLDYPLAKTRAATMLASGIQRASEERGLSTRKIGMLLNYKQAVVLSHMASGRVPIPIDRAEEFADVLQLDKTAFLAAVVEQRHPEVDWSLLASGASPSDEAGTLAHDLEAIAGRSLAQLSVDQRRVLREVVAEQYPRRRWLSVHEIPVMALIREHRPAINELGMDSADRAALISALKGTR